MLKIYETVSLHVDIVRVYSLVSLAHTGGENSGVRKIIIFNLHTYSCFRYIFLCLMMARAKDRNM